jgi:hypothetical protein
MNIEISIFPLPKGNIENPMMPLAQTFKHVVSSSILNRSHISPETLRLEEYQSLKNDQKVVLRTCCHVNNKRLGRLFKVQRILGEG